MGGRIYMSLFLGPMRQHIPGKKELTEKSELLHLMPKKEVYIPLVAGRTLDFDILVQEGDTVSVGTKLAETKSGFYVPIYSSVSGTYKGIVKRMHNSLRPQNHMVIECDFKQTKVQSFAPLDWQSATREECVDFVKNAGIVGLGGAGFPTYVKYMKPDGVDYVLINAVECEPYITADYRSVMDDAQDLVTGAKIMKKMAEAYGYDISKPATNAREAFQWLYFGYLAAIKTQNGAAMSVGRISTFLDIYIERDLANGTLTESEAQELVDHIVMKFRMVKFARIPSYNALFSGDPVWATLEVAGLGTDGRSMVTKNDYRFLHTLEDMGPSPEPNLTVLYTEALPENFKKYAAKISIDTSSIQYENDDVMRPVWGDDYSICCCVSATQTGKEMQFFGARANLAKCLTYAINGGVDEKTKQQVGPEYRGITSEYLDYDEVIKKYENMMGWLADLYVNTLNLIQYMHDKYYYEAAEMALIDTDVRRTFATGIAGFSHVVDSLSAIKYAKVKTIRDEDGIVVDYEVEGDFPRYGNDDDRADNIAVWLLHTFLEKIKQHHTYRNSEPTTSILTITSNVVYGKATGSLPDGRKAGEPLSPGANPAYGAEKNGLLASLNSVAKLPYEWALDGISNTQTIAPSALGHDEAERADKLVTVMDGYFRQGAHHLNVNVFGKEKLIDAMEHPEKPEYANFTIRVSGYAVKFIDLTREQQLDVIARTCHDHM